MSIPGAGVKAAQAWEEMGLRQATRPWSVTPALTCTPISLSFNLQNNNILFYNKNVVCVRTCVRVCVLCTTFETLWIPCGLVAKKKKKKGHQCILHIGVSWPPQFCQFEPDHSWTGVGGHPLRCREFNCPLPLYWIPEPTPSPSVTTKKVSGHCQRFLSGTKSPPVENHCPRVRDTFKFRPSSIASNRQ